MCTQQFPTLFKPKEIRGFIQGLGVVFMSLSWEESWQTRKNITQIKLDLVENISVRITKIDFH